MVKRALVLILVMAASFVFTGCAGEKMNLAVKAKIDGQPAAQAKITVDGVEEGLTGADGAFTKTLTKKPGAEVLVVVTKEMPGYRTSPWKTTFLMKLPKDGAVDLYSFDAELPAARYVTIAVREKAAPVADAVVKAAGKEVGKTGANGEFVYEYQTLPKEGIELTVTKSGYASWKRSGGLEPGQRLEAELAKRVTVTVTALTEEYGQSGGIPGISVTIDKKTVGKTDAKGVFTWVYDGEPGKKAPLILSAPGYIPSTWKTTLTLEGEMAVQRYFYPTTARPIRTGIYRFVGNTPNVDLKAVLAQTEEALEGQLFKFDCFKKVPSKTLQAEMKKAKLGIDKITTKGWRETPLKQTVDMIVLGSVAKDDQGFLIETKFYSSGGKLIHSQLARARSEGGIAGVTRDITSAVLAKFPFEGTVIGGEDDRPRINLGKSGYKISKGMEFGLLTPRVDETGRVSGYREIGKLKVRKAEDSSSLTEVENLKKGEKVSPGDRVVRLVIREDEGQEKNSVIVSAKGGLPPDVSPLAGVNIYLNEEWVSTTGSDGKAEVPVKLGKKYDLILYRHGYQQVSDKMRVEKNRDVKEYSLTVNNALFKVDSQPSAADVSVDGEKFGRTPITDGKPVTLGFHTVKVSLGGDYRDWEEVVEFASKIEDRTGARSIVLHKNFLKIGERAEQRGDMDGAIIAYRSTEKGHPDYSETHHRLAQIYLDDKSDYDAAIREFENVLSLPENEQLVYKQFSVAFTNLGHAYYEKGNALVAKDKEAAAQNFAKAIKNLQRAKQNTRFFPTMRYDEAVHDTFFYTALSFHKLYLITKKSTMLNDANLAWSEYFDFFPQKLEGNAAYEQSREAGQKYWDQIKSKM
ncbi:MAG: PEGA domain-containing protein [Nitrospirota bacterium]